MPPVEKQQITIIHPGALGDSVLSLPTLQVLKQVFSENHLTVIGYPRYWEWLKGWFINDLFSPDSLPLYRLFEPASDTSDPSLNFLAHQDIIISWFGDETFRKNLTHLCSGRVIVEPFHHQQLKEHASTFFLESLKPLGIPMPSQQTIHSFRLNPPLSPAATNLALPERPHILIHPGSGSPHKCWPIKKFARLIQRIYWKWRKRPLLLLGEADSEIKNALLSILDRDECLLAENLNLSEVLAILQHCDVYIGNDSGISHLAGVLGVPTLVLFGPTNPDIWHPLGPNVQILYNPQLNQSVEDVWNRLITILNLSDD